MSDERKVQRHAADLERAQKRFADDYEQLVFFLKEGLKAPNNLGMIMTTAGAVVNCGAVAEPTSPKIPLCLRVMAQAGAGLIELAHRGGTVAVSLGDFTANYAGGLDSSLIHASRWLNSFFVNVLCGNMAAVDQLCQIPVDVLRDSTTRDLEYRYLFVEAVQSYWQQHDDASGRILRALEATDPTESSSDWTLSIDFPQMQLLFYVLGGDEAFEGALLEALESHKQFWSSNAELRRDVQGYTSIPLSALAAMALSSGMNVTAESDYLLQPLWSEGAA